MSSFSPPAPSFSTETLSEIFDHDNHAKRREFRKMVRDDLFSLREGLSVEDERKLAHERLKAYCQRGAISIFDFEKNPLNLTNALEMVGMVDPSSAIKASVQFNLFGGSIMLLGTERHRKYLSGIDDLSVFGCFCFTELGYGNNATEMQTTATWDDQSHEFIINSPNALSQKIFATNFAVHADYAIVFAQLYFGGANEGIHAFLIRIRGQGGSFVQGACMEDMGKMMEGNGVDVGKVTFNNVRVPREALLNRWSDVDEKGRYTSQVKRKFRFAKVTDQLLSGRLCIAAMALGATKTSLYVALVYSVNRLAVGSSGRSDTPVISYQLQQQALIPPVARTIILNFGLNYAKRQWSHTLPQSSIPVNQETVVRQICVIKSLVTWNFERSASIARQKCGGWGYISKNRLAANVGYSHGSVTSEGDNAVIMQKVTKGLMSALRSGQHVLTGDIGREVWNVRLVDHCVELVGRVREAVLVKKLDAEIETRVKNGKTLFDVWMYEISDLVQHVALAYGERMCIEEAVAVIASIEDVSTRNTLTSILHIFLLQILSESTFFFITPPLRSSYTAQTQETAQELFNQKIADIAPQILNIVRAWGVPESVTGDVALPTASSHEHVEMRVTAAAAKL